MRPEGGFPTFQEKDPTAVALFETHQAKVSCGLALLVTCVVRRIRPQYSAMPQGQRIGTMFNFSGTMSGAYHLPIISFNEEGPKALFPIHLRNIRCLPAGL